MTLENKLGMWGLNQDVSIVADEAISYVQYLGKVGEVGEGGKYFGEAGVISAGARDSIMYQSNVIEVHSHAMGWEEGRKKE